MTNATLTRTELDNAAEIVYNKTEAHLSERSGIVDGILCIIHEYKLFTCAYPEFAGEIEDEGMFMIKAK